MRAIAHALPSHHSQLLLELYGRGYSEGAERVISSARRQQSSERELDLGDLGLQLEHIPARSSQEGSQAMPSPHVCNSQDLSGCCSADAGLSSGQASDQERTVTFAGTPLGGSQRASTSGYSLSHKLCEGGRSSMSGEI